MNAITPIRPVERPYRQIGDPAKCAWCGERAKSAFVIVDVKRTSRIVLCQCVRPGPDAGS